MQDFVETEQEDRKNWLQATNIKGNYKFERLEFPLNKHNKPYNRIVFIGTIGGYSNFPDRTGEILINQYNIANFNEFKDHLKSQNMAKGTEFKAVPENDLIRLIPIEVVS